MLCLLGGFAQHSLEVRLVLVLLALQSIPNWRACKGQHETPLSQHHLPSQTAQTLGRVPRTGDGLAAVQLHYIQQLLLLQMNWLPNKPTYTE